MTRGRIRTDSVPSAADPSQPAVHSTIEEHPVDPATENQVLITYKKILGIQFASTVIVLGYVAVVLWKGFFSENSPPLLLPLLAAAGALGALFSALTRLYHVDEAGRPIVSKTVSRLGFFVYMYSLTPLIIGAIAAIALFIAFAGKLVTGDLFPKISCVHGECSTIREMLLGYWPTKPEDYSKALFWAFVAGFSERFVPNIVEMISGKATKRRGK